MVYTPNDWSQVVVETGTNANPSLGPCWIWQTKPTAQGYAMAYMGSKTTGTNHKVYAHRLVYEALVGVIPPGMELDHLCSVRNCVNPEHLEVVTHRENIRRGQSPAGVNADKTECDWGHPLSGENLAISTSGKRRCRTCNRPAFRRWRKGQR